MDFSRIKVVLLAVIMLAASTGYGQTYGEIFRQKRTQREYLLKQIAALHLYAGYLRKGYDIASSGLETVKGLTGGEFSLHSTFISSLKSVSPAIRNNVKVAEIIAWQLSITKAFNGIRNHELLKASDQSYIKGVMDKIAEECAADLEELLMVISYGKVEMSDDERIERLEKIHLSMRDKSAFTQSFCSQINLLIQNRNKEIQSINQLKQNYEINH